LRRPIDVAAVEGAGVAADVTESLVELELVDVGQEIPRTGGINYVLS